MDHRPKGKRGSVMRGGAYAPLSALRDDRAALRSRLLGGLLVPGDQVVGLLGPQGLQRLLERGDRGLGAVGPSLVLGDEALELAPGEVGLGEPLGHRRGELRVLGGTHAEQLDVGSGGSSPVGGVLTPRLEHLGPHHPQRCPRQRQGQHRADAQPQGRLGRQGHQHGQLAAAESSATATVTRTLR